MVESIKQQIDVLVKLQDIELEGSKLKIDLDKISERIGMLDSELKEFENKMKEAESRIHPLQKAYRLYESDVEINQATLRKSHEKLASVKNNKEYQSILKEIDDMKNKNSQIEDKMIECLNTMDEVEHTVKRMRKEYSSLSEKNKIEKEDIYIRLDQGKQKLDDIYREWETVSKTVEPELMKQYLQLKEQIKGGVMAPVKNSVCDGCHMNIPAQMYNELQRFDSLKYCPFCRRIIYWKN